MIEKEKQSKNEKAKALCGIRGSGTPFLEPWELGYSCPTCAPSITESNLFDKEGMILEIFERLHFSEYNGFMYCEHCNIDIPSYLCAPRPLTIEQAQQYTERYLNLLTEFRERWMGQLTPGRKTLQTQNAFITDLEKRIAHLEWDVAIKEDILKMFRKDKGTDTVSKIAHGLIAGLSDDELYFLCQTINTSEKMKEIMTGKKFPPEKW